MAGRETQDESQYGLDRSRGSASPRRARTRYSANTDQRDQRRWPARGGDALFLPPALMRLNPFICSSMDM